MLGGFSVAESEPVFDLGTAFILQHEDALTQWHNLSSYKEQSKAMAELRQLQRFNPSLRYRIVKASGSENIVVYDTSTDTRARHNLGRISNLMGGI